MIRSARAGRVALAVWVALAIVVWNGLYDLRISLGIRDYLLAQALHESGRGPAVDLSAAMRETVRDAVSVASLWAAILFGAGLWTIRILAGGGSAAGRG